MTEVATVNAKDLARQQYGHELDWAIGTSERVDVDVPRAEAARKLAEKYPEVEPVEVWRAVVDGVARHVERPREINGSRLQLFIGATIRVDDKILIPVEHAHRLDWVAWYARHEDKARDAAQAFDRVTAFFETIIARFRGAKQDASTFDVADDLFAPPDEDDDVDDDVETDDEG